MTARPKADARCRILSAAEAIVRRLGARHLTLDAAAQEAGVSKGGVLYHFPGKTALLEGMVRRGVAGFADRVAGHRALLAGGPNPTLRALIRAGREVLACEIDLRSGMIAAVGENPELLDPVRSAIARHWRQVAAETSDPAAAYIVWSAMEGVLFLASFGLAPVGAAERLDYYDRLEALAADLPGRDFDDAV